MSPSTLHACLISAAGDGHGEVQPFIMSAVASQAVFAGMQEVFSSLGEIKEIRIVKDRLPGLSAGYGFVRYLHPSVSELARQVLNSAILCGLVCCLALVCLMALSYELAPLRRAIPHLVVYVCCLTSRLV